QPDVIDLRYARQKELERPAEEILQVVFAERCVERAVDLIEIEIPSGPARRAEAFPLAVDVNLLDQRVELLVRDEPATVAFALVGSDIDDTDAVVRIEHGDGVRRPDLDPAL